MSVSIRGTGFEDAPGRVLVGDMEVPIRVTSSGWVLWNDREIVIQIPEELVSGVIRVETASGRTFRGPELLLDQGPREVDGVYERHISSYAQRNDLDQDWVDWMLDSRPLDRIDDPASIRDRGLLVFTTQWLERKKINVAYTYHEGQPYRVREPWPVHEVLQELAHMRALEEMMEAAYPGYQFTFSYDADPLANDLVIRANYPPPSRYVSEHVRARDGRMGGVVPTIHCTNDGVLVHEIGHFLGLRHHYEQLDSSDIGEGKAMPPGSRTCQMDRTVGWCTSCLASLDIDPATFSRERLERAVSVLSEHYLRWNAVPAMR